MIDYLKKLLLRFFILLLNVIKNLKVIIQKKPILGVMLLVFLLNNIFINHTLFTQHLGNNSQKNDYTRLRGGNTSGSDSINLNNSSLSNMAKNIERKSRAAFKPDSKKIDINIQESDIKNIKFSGSSSGSGNGGSNPPSNDPDWSQKAFCPDPQKSIDSSDFWNSDLEYLKTKSKQDTSPNPERLIGEDEDLVQLNDIIEVPISQLKRRRLLEIRPTPSSNQNPTPTSKLDKPIRKKFNFSTHDFKPFKYKSRDGNELSLKNKPIEKITYCHYEDLGKLDLNANQVIECPIQPDMTKYQRKSCRSITDEAKVQVLKRVMEMTTSTDSNFISSKIQMPYFPSQNALVYMDLDTKSCVLFHENGELWTVKKLSQLEIIGILEK